MDGELLKFLIEAGGNGFLIFLVIRLMNRIDTITDRILTNDEEAKAERQAIAKASGLDTQDLSFAVREYRRKGNGKEETH